MAGTQSARLDVFENYSIPRAVFTLSLPTVAGSLVSLAYSMADTYFVGLLNDPVQTAAVTLAAPVLLAFNAVNNLFGVGCSSMMSRALGRGDYKTLRQSSSFGFWGSLAGGLIFSILTTLFMAPLLALLGCDATTADPTSTYLGWTVSLGAIPAILNVVCAYMVRSEGSALHASIGTMSGCFLNIILDPIFIIGFEMGSTGAALATFLSNCFAVLYFLVYFAVRRGKTLVCIDPRELLHLRGMVVTGVFAVGVPASVQNILNVIGSTILNNLAAPYGAAVLAAMGICSKLNMVPFYVMQGMSQGIMPLVSYTYAAKKPQRMKSAFNFTLKICMTALISCCVIFFLFSDYAVRLFIDEPETIAYGSVFLKGMCLSVPLLGLDFLGLGLYQAVGMGSYALFFALARKLVLEIPLMYLLNFLVPLYGLPYAQPAAELVMAIAAVFAIRSVFVKAEKEAQIPIHHDHD